MRFSRLIISGLLCIGLIACYCLFERCLLQSGNLGEAQGRPLFTFSEGDVTGITLEGTTTVVLEKKDNLWRISEPVQTAADQTEAGRLVSALVELRARETLNEPGDLSPFGLCEPALSLHICTRTGDHVLFVGSDSPTSSFSYVRLDGRREVNLISAREKAGLDRDLLSLRDRRLISLEPQEIQRVSITRGAMILEFLEDRDGLWRCTGDDIRKLDQEIIKRFLRQACGAAARAYPAVPPELGSHDVSIALHSAGVSQTLGLWGRAGEKGTVYASSDLQELPVQADGSLLDAIPGGIEQVLDRSVVELEGKEVTGITLSGQKDLDIRKQGNRWFSGTRRLDCASSMHTFLDCLAGIQYADRYLALPEDTGEAQHIGIFCGDSLPAFDITLYSKYYMTVGKKVYRISEEDMQVFRVSLEMLLNDMR